MKPIRVIVLALCCAAACNEQDTTRTGEWRATAARLSSDTEYREFREAARPTAPPKPNESCYADVQSHEEAAALLKNHPQCIEQAIERLGRYAPFSARATSDVAAAYYMRAKRHDRPVDLFHALNFADAAVEADRSNAAARFNQALIQEELGLDSEALASWNAVLRLERNNGWEKEARHNRDRLARATPQWGATKAALLQALRARDAAALASLIKAFPRSAHEYFEETLLPQWAAAPSPEKLAELELFANELSRQLIGDRYAVSIVRALKTGAIQQGVLEFAGARADATSYGYGRAAPRLKRAAQLLGDNPLRLLCELSYAYAVSFSEPERASPLFASLEKETTRLGLRHLRGRIYWLDGWSRAYQSSYLETIRLYDKAIDDFRSTGDEQSIVDIHVRRSGIYQSFGQYDLAARAALLTTRNDARLAETRHKHAYLGELSELAIGLGYPEIALLYQNKAVNLSKADLAGSQSQQNLATAYRKRAAIHLHLGRLEQAKHDLAQASRHMLLARPDDRNVAAITDARQLAVQGRYELERDPRAAVTSFTLALSKAEREFLTLRAVLYAQRAEAHARLNDVGSAIADLTTAIEILGEEEKNILEDRRSSEGDELWPAYFARFQDTYRALIEKLIDNGNYPVAFEYVEKARAFEPLMLVLQRQRTAIPRAYRELAAGGSSITALQASLEPGTFVIEYYIAGNTADVWVIARDKFEILMLPVDSGAIQRWTRDLQNAARRRIESLEGTLNAPFEELLRAPLARIEQMRAGQPLKRLVIVPDPSMYGLPFPALFDSEAKRHLIEMAPVEIAYSAALYRTSLALDARLLRTNPPSILLLGNPFFDRRLDVAQGLELLPGAEEEVHRVAPVYDNAEVRIREQATIPEFLRLAPEYNVLHIAAHGIATPNQPTGSLILLAPSGEDSGALTAAQLLDRLKLTKTRLVVLSACSSAGGNPPGTGGVAPLVRPLIAAGVPGVIGTLWEVEDTTADDLLVSFHSAWRSGDDAAAALQRAQVAMIRQSRYSPLDWAPFQVIGHASSPKEPSR